jgi:alpha-glucosidase (family GH31 glycosyl hydrolase)
MNEPAVFGTNEEKPFNWPDSAKPYWSLKCPDDEYENVDIKASFVHTSKDKPINQLSDKTLCMSAVQGENDEYKHFDVHSLYGYMQQIPTFEAAQKLDNTRGLVITRSNFIGTGQYAGHWTGVCSCFSFFKQKILNFLS